MFVDLSGSDFDEAADAFGSNSDYAPILLSPSGRKFWWRQTARGDETLSLRKKWSYSRMEMGSVLTGEHVVVAWVESGESVFQSGRSVTAVPQEVPFVMLSGRHWDKAVATDLVCSTVLLDRAFLRGVAEELDDVRFIDFVPLAPAHPRSVATWSKTVSLLADVILDDSPVRAELIRGEMSRLVAVAMLTSFPYRSENRAPGPSGVEPASVRLAVEYIHENAHLPIGPIEVAGAAGLSVRSLQSALRRHRGTTPAALLREVRLDRAHAELTQADPKSATVAGIARGWGFLHLGRFSASYRTRFNELPGVTLRGHQQGRPL